MAGFDYEIRKTLDDDVLVSTGHNYNDSICYHKCQGILSNKNSEWEFKKKRFKVYYFLK